MNLAGFDRPKVCKGVGINRNTVHSLRIACATKLFNSAVEEKLIRERTGHRSNALLTYEKPSLEQSAKVSNLLGPCTSSSVTEASGSGSTVSETLEIVNSARGMFNSGTFLNCTVNVNVNSKQ